MHKLVFTFFIFAFFMARAGDSVENGAGLAEQNFQSILMKLDLILTDCQRSPLCLQSGPEKVLLARIIKALPEERANPKILIFESNKQSKRFERNGPALIYLTEPAVAASIFINVDLIYSESLVPPIPFSEGQALATFLLALATHQGQGSGYFIESFSIKIRTFFESTHGAQF